MFLSRGFSSIELAVRVQAPLSMGVISHRENKVTLFDFDNQSIKLSCRRVDFRGDRRTLFREAGVLRNALCGFATRVDGLPENGGIRIPLGRGSFVAAFCLC